MQNRKASNATSPVVLYARVSTERQAIKDLSIPDQLKRMRAYCEAREFIVSDEYIDEGRTATDDNRPAFQEMIHNVMNSKEKIHAIVVHSFSRAFRNVTDLALYLRSLSQVGTRLISVTQDVDDSPIGRFVTLFYGLVDEMNSAENSKHVKRALRENALRGFFNGSRPPYGYKTAETKVIGRTGYRKILVLDEDETAIVREIFDLYEGVRGPAAMGMKKIAECLNAKCLCRGQLWRVQKIQKVLSDPVYTGVFEFGARWKLHNRDTTPRDSDGIALDQDDDSVVSVPVPVIIEKERFQRVEGTRAARAPRNTPPLHVTPRTLLTGLCHCGYCQSSMQIVTGKSGHYRYLKCSRRHMISGSICSSPNVPYDRFEKMILRTVVEHVLTECRLKTILDDCCTHADRLANDQGTEHRQIADAKAKVERKLTNLYRLIEDEKVRIDGSLGGRIQSWQDELKGLTVKLNSLKVPVALPANIANNIDVRTFRAAAIALLESPGSEDARAFMHLVVGEIRVYADEVSVSGPNLGVLEAALAHTRAAIPTVPSFMSNWRREGDSNPR
ncbi:serine recombinase [Pandoraea anapnoica]|uniref:Serine recombinase n=1 Tax=Pandoraea anapnoica TaxID=2508301 RepID=A0A5E5ADC4_9BURK|nr:recombinase family protein [Pandoraea anapnoica]VVE71651.1 serine recombinase [Pandoraea anapnoica]